MTRSKVELRIRSPLSLFLLSWRRTHSSRVLPTECTLASTFSHHRDYSDEEVLYVSVTIDIRVSCIISTYEEASEWLQRLNGAR